MDIMSLAVKIIAVPDLVCLRAQLATHSVRAATICLTQL
jgi:hypothetical protein